MKRLIVIGILLVTMSASAEDTVYQWTDKDGNVQYSDKPPPLGTDAVEKTLEPTPKAGTVNTTADGYRSTPGSTDSIAESVKEYNDDITQQRRNAPDIKAKQEVECELAQHTIDKLSAARYVQIAGPDGTLRVMSEAERSERIRMANYFIEKYCP